MEMFRTPLVEGRSRGWPIFAGLVLVASLFFVWPIPRTISLRDLLLVACTGLFAWLAYRDRHVPFPWKSLRAPLGLFLALSVWIVFVALVVSDETAWALGEIKGQWLKACIALVAGGLVGVAALQDDLTCRLTLMAGATALLLHVLYVDYEAIRLIWAGAKIGRLSGLTEGSDKSNYLTNILLFLLLAEILLRTIAHRRFLPFGNVPLATVAGVALFSVYVEGMRNGIVEFVSVLAASFFVVMASAGRRRRAMVVGAMLVLVSVSFALGYLNMRKDERWQSFLETVPIALDIENHAWVNEGFPQPTLESGRKVDWSNYMRIARARVGIELVQEYPLGVGYGRNAFGHAVEMKYGEKTSHSHSGLVDLAAGTGIPGALLWLGFLGSLFVLGWRCFRQTRDYCALALLLLTTGYGVRMVLDSIIRDHMLQMFLFLAAFLAVAAARSLDEKTVSVSAPRA